MAYQGEPQSTRQRMRPWLENRINSGEIAGLEWIDKTQLIFKVPWKHVNKREWKEDDSQIFKVAFIAIEIALIRSTNTGITNTCPCNIPRIFSEAKNEKFVGKFLICLILFVAQNIDCAEAVLTSTHNLRHVFLMLVKPFLILR